MIIAKGQDLIEVKPEILIGGIYDVDLPKDTNTHILERRRPCIILCRYGESMIYGAIPLTSEKVGKDYTSTNKNTKYIPLDVDRTKVSYACINQFRPVDERMIDVTKLSGRLHPNKVKLIIRELIEYIDQDNICNSELLQLKETLTKTSTELAKVREENYNLRKEIANLKLQLDKTSNKVVTLNGIGDIRKIPSAAIIPSPVVDESNLSTNSIITLDKKFDIPWTQKAISELPAQDIIELFTTISKVGYKPMAKARGVNHGTLSVIKQTMCKRNLDVSQALEPFKGSVGCMVGQEVEIKFVDNSVKEEATEVTNESVSIPAELPNYRHMGLTMYKALNLSLDQMKEFVEYSKIFDISKLAEAYGISNTVSAAKIRSRLVSKVHDAKRNTFVSC